MTIRHRGVNVAGLTAVAGLPLAVALSEIRFFVVVSALLALTLTLDNFRFETDHAPLAENLDFSAGLTHWTASDDAAISLDPDTPPTLTLAQQKGGSLVTLRRDVPEAARYRYLRFAADYRVSDVTPGDRDWHRARIVLVGLDGRGEPMWRAPHHLFRDSGSGPWRHAEAVFRVPRDAHAVRLMVQLAKVAGELSVRNLTLRAAREGSWYPSARAGVLLAWAVLAVWAASRACAAGTRRRWRIAGAAVLLAIALVPLWQGDRADKATPLPPLGFLDIAAQIAPAPPKPAPPPATPSAQAAPKPAPPADAMADLWRDAKGLARRHSDWLRFAVYAGLAILLLHVCRADIGAWRPAIYLAYPAVAAEIVQALPRDFFGWDDVVDLLAALGGILCAVGIFKLRRSSSVFN